LWSGCAPTVFSARPNIFPNLSWLSWGVYHHITIK
jgi:hypothetical protein